MRHLIIAAALLAACAALASDLWVGTIVGSSAGASVNNTTTDAGSGHFPLTCGYTYAVQCGSDSCVVSGRDAGNTLASCTAMTDGGVAVKAVKVSGGLLYDVPLPCPHSAIAVQDQGGGIPNCDVFIVANPN